MNVSLRGIPTKRWGYSQAFADNIILTMKRTGADTEDLEEHLNKQFGHTPDNKTTFEMVADSYSGRYYVTFHDYTIYIGTAVRPYAGATLPEGQVRS